MWILGEKGHSELGITTRLSGEPFTAAEFNRYIAVNLASIESVSQALESIACDAKKTSATIIGLNKALFPHCPFCGGISFRANKYRGWDECVGCGSPKSND